MIGELLTPMPGSSRAFLGGAIAYANDEKVRQLGVAAGDARRPRRGQRGDRARDGARRAASGSASTIAVAVAGVAGPDGGTPEKPVGTVWLALACGTADRDEEADVAGRRAIRSARWSSWWALPHRSTSGDAHAAERARAAEQAQSDGARQAHVASASAAGSGSRARSRGTRGCWRADLARRATPASTSVGRADELPRDAEVPRLDARARRSPRCVDALDDGRLRGRPRLTFRTARLGAFPSLEKASVLWAGVEDPPALARSRAASRPRCSRRSATRPSARPFHPHVTLGEAARN